ncbi:hypothetical protein THIOKS11490006 [Thiocapsa sp. KS1]|nr:hypothetical protein THIOKS11490006 [Thiocapsa sp. KS1]
MLAGVGARRNPTFGAPPSARVSDYAIANPTYGFHESVGRVRRAGTPPLGVRRGRRVP